MIEQRALKQLQRETSLTKVPPSVEEMTLIHELYLECIKYIHNSESKPPNFTWMGDTIQNSLTLCMPHDRNIHNFIFGGFLIRLAFELAYGNAVMFARSDVRFLSLDDIVFRKPVPIGSFLALSSQIVYSIDSQFQVSVRADVVNPYENTRDTTNTFYFTFSISPILAPRVMPRSYDER